MNAIAAFYANEALQLANERAADYRRQAEHDRMGAALRPSRSILSPVQSTVAAIRSAFRSVEPDFGPAVPKLADYPYRG